MDIPSNFPSFSYEDLRLSKDIFRLQVNRLCLSIETGSLEEVLRQLNDLKSQSQVLHDNFLLKELQRLESFVHQHWPINQNVPLEKLQELHKIFELLDYKTIL